MAIFKALQFTNVIAAASAPPSKHYSSYNGMVRVYKSHHQHNKYTGNPHRCTYCAVAIQINSIINIRPY